MPVLPLALALVLPASATYTPKIKNIRIRQTSDTVSYRVQVLSPDADADVADMAAELDGEPVGLAESDAWLHGATALSAAPEDEATLRLTAYGVDSAELGAFVGTVSGGSVTLSSADRGDGGDCQARVGCEDTGGDGGADLDLEVLSVRLLDDGRVSLDLAGADVLSVASLELTASSLVETDVCVVTDRTGACIGWETELLSETAEVDLDELGVVWESGDVDVDGVTTLRLRATDADGRRLDRARVDVAAPWLDGGAGVSVVAVDEDPLTTVGVMTRCIEWDAEGATCLEQADALVVASTGWSAEDEVPALAEVRLDGGETVEIPAHGYQRTGGATLADGALDLDALGVTVDGQDPDRVLSVEGGTMHLFGVQGIGVIVKHDDADGVTGVSVTAWGEDAATIRGSVAVAASDGAGVYRATVALDEEVAAVFGVDVDLDGDAVGLDLRGRVRLRGEADGRGRRDTLARGRFAGQLGTDGDGELDLATIDPDGSTVSRGDILIIGEPIGIERQVGDTAVPQAPPVLRTEACGYGTDCWWRHHSGGQTQQSELL